ncbi:MAG: hypothetical protein FJ308_14970, partial [Planctomycetes bacterium]|nr:hypothetical protein [Planctomycetota bacterium]
MSNPWDSEKRSDDAASVSSLLSIEEESIEEDRIPRWAYRWGLGLLALATLGHLFIPLLIFKYLDDSLSFGRAYLSNRWFPVFEILGAFFVGLWLAQYIAIWLWLHSYLKSRITRWMIGLFLSMAISYLEMAGMSLVWGPPPIEAFLFCFLGGAAVYSLLGLVLSVLLRSSNFKWQPRASFSGGTGDRYSLKTLLGAMVGSALLMIAIKSFPLDKRASGGETAQQITFLSVWLAWQAVAISIQTWLQLGVILSHRRRRFLVCFSVAMLLGPALSHAIGLWLIRW